MKNLAVPIWAVSVWVATFFVISLFSTPAVLGQDTSSQEVKRLPRIYALLIDWTGEFIGKGSKPRLVKEKAFEHSASLLFPSSGESSVGFDPKRDRLFVAYFGLLTNRPRDEVEPLEDFLQIHLNVAQRNVTRRDLQNAINRRTKLRTENDQSGAQYGYPSIAWTFATHRINQEARKIGLQFESINLLMLTDGRGNNDRGKEEKSVCFDLIGGFSASDALTFNEFYRVYDNNLEVEEVGLGVGPIRGIGEDNQGFLNGLRIRPKPAGIKLADALKIESESKGFEVTHGGTYQGQVTLEPRLGQLGPARARGLSVELLDGERGVHGPAEIDLEAGRQVVWTELPGDLGSGGVEDRQYPMRAAVTIDYPNTGDGEYLSQFVSPLTYVTPVPVVRVAGWLEDAKGDLITPARMEVGETPEQARKRINAAIGGSKIRLWATTAAIAALVSLGILYLIFFFAPPRLDILAEDPRSVEIDLRNPLTEPTVAHLGSVRILNRHQKRGRFGKWNGHVEIDEINARPGLLFADGVRIGDVVTFEKSGEPGNRSPKAVEREFKVFELYLRPDLVVDLDHPGYPDSQGRFEVELEISLSLHTRAKANVTRCQLKVPMRVLAPPVRWQAEWVDGEEEPRFFYSDLVDERQVVKRVRIYHEQEQQALWPQVVRLVVGGPKEEVNPDLRFGECAEAGGEAESKFGMHGAEVLVPRFGPQRELVFPVYHGADKLQEPTQRDEEVAMQLYRVEADFLVSYGGPTRFWVGLKDNPPFPLVRLTAYDDAKPVLIEYPQRKENSPPYLFEPRSPKAGGRKVSDPWEVLALVELGNRAEKPQPARRHHDDGRILTGEASFHLQRIFFHSDLPELDLDEADWEQRFRLVRLEERQDPKASDFLRAQAPFAQQVPAREGPQRYRLEFNQFDYDKLRTEYSELKFTLSIAAYLDHEKVGELSQTFILPLIVDYGHRWFLMDIGTSAIAAMVVDRQRETREYLELQRQQEKEESAFSALQEKEPVEEDVRLLPTNLFIEPQDEERNGKGKDDGFVLDFNTETDVMLESTHQLPPFKLLVGSRKLQLPKEVLARLRLEEPPEVDDVLKQAVEILLERYIKPALGKDKELPNQCVLSVPNTFTPAHCTLLKSMFQKHFGIDRVLFLSESDAVCWHYVSEFEFQGDEEAPLAEGIEYALIVDVGAGTTDLTYVALNRQEDDGSLQSATIVHRDGFKVAGNNVDTCLSRILHHKVDALCGLPGSHLAYDPQARLFASEEEEEGQRELVIRDRFNIAQGIRRLKRHVSPNGLHATRTLRVPSTSMFIKRKERQETERSVEFVKGAIAVGVDQDTYDEFTLLDEEFLHAPAYRRLVTEGMTDDLVEHFFSGCPKTWPDAPEDWKPSEEHFPIDTLIMTGRGSLTPGFRDALARSVDRMRPVEAPELSTPDFSGKGKRPEDLKFAVLNGACSYLEMYGAGAAHDDDAQVRDSGLYEDYYLYTGRGNSFKKRFPLLTRDRDLGRSVDLPGAPGNPAVRRFAVQDLKIPFRDADGKVVILATTSNPPPEHPFKTGGHARLVCHFTQERKNREVEIDFSVDSDKNIQLAIDKINYEDRAMRYDNDLVEQDFKVRDNLWPGRPATPGTAAEHFSLHLPRRVQPSQASAPPETGDELMKMAATAPTSEPEMDLPEQVSVTHSANSDPHQMQDPFGIQPAAAEPTTPSPNPAHGDGMESSGAPAGPVFSTDDDEDDDE